MKSKIEYLINKYNFSYYDLSRCADISLSTLYRLKNNKNISVEHLLKIACALDCGLDDLVEIDNKIKEEIERKLFNKEENND